MVIFSQIVDSFVRNWDFDTQIVSEEIPNHYTGRGNADKQIKHRKDENPDAVSQNYWRQQRSEKNDEEPFYTN